MRGSNAYPSTGSTAPHVGPDWKAFTEPGCGAAPRWHLVHQWIRWHKATHIVTSLAGVESKVERQERTCVRCGWTQQRRLAS